MCRRALIGPFSVIFSDILVTYSKFQFLPLFKGYITSEGVCWNIQNLKSNLDFFHSGLEMRLFLMFIIALKVVVLHAHFILEIKAKGYEFISVNVFLHKIMRFLGKKG